jgi:hypothetical protein
MKENGLKNKYGENSSKNILKIYGGWRILKKY